MHVNIARFFCTFVFLLACFALSGESSIFNLLGIPDHPAIPAFTALVFTSLIFRVNLIVVGLACFFFYLANSGLSTAGIIPRPEFSLAIAATLSVMPALNSMMSG